MVKLEYVCVAMLAFVMTALAMTATSDARICPEENFWDNQLGKCVICTICKGLTSATLYPCEVYRDALCGTVEDLKELAESQDIDETSGKISKHAARWWQSKLRLNAHHRQRNQHHHPHHNQHNHHHRKNETDTVAQIDAEGMMSDRKSNDIDAFEDRTGRVVWIQYEDLSDVKWAWGVILGITIGVVVGLILLTITVCIAVKAHRRSRGFSVLLDAEESPPNSRRPRGLSGRGRSSTGDWMRSLAINRRRLAMDEILQRREQHMMPSGLNLSPDLPCKPAAAENHYHVDLLLPEKPYST